MMMERVFLKREKLEENPLRQYSSLLSAQMNIASMS